MDLSKYPVNTSLDTIIIRRRKEPINIEFISSMYGSKTNIMINSSTISIDGQNYDLNDIKNMYLSYNNNVFLNVTFHSSQEVRHYMVVDFEKIYNVMVILFDYFVFSNEVNSHKLTSDEYVNCVYAPFDNSMYNFNNYGLAYNIEENETKTEKSIHYKGGLYVLKAILPKEYFNNYKDVGLLFNSKFLGDSYMDVWFLVSKKEGSNNKKLLIVISVLIIIIMFFLLFI